MYVSEAQNGASLLKIINWLFLVTEKNDQHLETFQDKIMLILCIQFYLRGEQDTNLTYCKIQQF